MKKVVSGKNLQQKIKESIDYLSCAVTSTLGPKGSNVIIDHSLFMPFITNDGATIAKNIESEDEIINTILEIAKSSSLKTNEIVGDGTTTTILFLQCIFNASLKYLENKKNPIILKKELDSCLEKIIENLKKEAKVPNKNDFYHIASVASNDYLLGKICSDAFSVVKNKNAIILEEVDDNRIDLEFINGYVLNTNLVSDYFLKGKKSISLDNACVLIIHDYMSNLENISFILNDCMKNKKSLIIFVNEYDENILRELVSFSLEQVLDCCILKLNEYGFHGRKIEKDLEIITNAKVIENYDFISSINVGFISNAVITNDNTELVFKKTKKIEEYVSLLEEEITEYKNEYEQDFYHKRIAMFQNGLAKISVGAPTKIESHEKKMRIEDALWALESSKDGVLLGGGVTLLKIASLLSDNEAEGIFKETLEKPFLKIFSNAGLDSLKIKKEIEDACYQKVYNVKEEKMEEAKNTTILDSLNVVTTSLINATSIATMLLTTSSLVINEYQNNLNKVNEYTEL